MNLIINFSDIAEAVKNINSAIGRVVWGTPMIVLILATGIYFSVRTGFFQISKIKLWLNETLFAIFKKKSVTKSNDENAISQFQALSTALAASIGTGNIAGVATAIAAGGPGAIFWMWISAFFGMMTSYGENVLGIYYRQKNNDGEWCGGAMYYLKEGLRDKKFFSFLSSPLAFLFAFFCVFASFGIGNMVQVNNISTSLLNAFVPVGGAQIPTIVTGLVLASIIGLVLLGGIKRIGLVTEKFVPFMAVMYMAGTLFIFFANIQNVPDVFGAIFKGAFGIKAIAGGISGAMIKSAVSVGFKRGVFSNEAGLGSSVLVNSVSDVKEPAVQGMWGIFQVFFDTIIMCTLTAFALLSTGVVNLTDGSVAGNLQGSELVTAAFSTQLGDYAGVFVAIATLFFAFSTVLGWSFYGTKAVEYLWGKKATKVYKVLYVLFIVVGATMDLTLAWEISDTLNGLMAVPNLIGLLLLSRKVFAITKNYTARKITKTSTATVPILSAYKDIQLQQECALAQEYSPENQN